MTRSTFQAEAEKNKRGGSRPSSPHGSSHRGASLPHVLINCTKKAIMQTVPLQEAAQRRRRDAARQAGEGRRPLVGMSGRTPRRLRGGLRSRNRCLRFLDCTSRPEATAQGGVDVYLSSAPPPSCLPSSQKAAQAENSNGQVWSISRSELQ